MLLLLAGLVRGTYMSFISISIRSFVVLLERYGAYYTKTFIARVSVV